MAIFEHMGINGHIAKRNQSNRHPDYRRYYSSEIIDVVSNLFKEDVERLGYMFE